MTKLGLVITDGVGYRNFVLSDFLDKAKVKFDTVIIYSFIPKEAFKDHDDLTIVELSAHQEQFNHWFSNLKLNLTSSLRVENGVPYFGESNEINDLVIDLVYTGENTMTASRLAQVRDTIRGDTFFMTYGDGLSDVSLSDLYQTHAEGGYSVTITGVSPLGRFGEIEYSGTQVTDFSEKPFDNKRRINGGFMCAEKSFIDQYILNGDPDIMLEEQPLQQCSADGKLGMFLHDGYWQCMDNPRDFELLSRHAMQQKLPWY